MSANPGILSGAKKFLILAALLYLATPGLQAFMTSGSARFSATSQAQREARNTSAFAVMLGEFRTSIGDMLFIKTERYLDSGIGYEPHIDAREMEKTGSADKVRNQNKEHENSESDPNIPVRLEAEADAHDHEDSHDHDAHAHDDHDSHAHEDEHAHDDHGHSHDHAHDHDHDHAHEEESTVQTLIRTANQDFRGFIGHLEREVKPWRDPSEPHQHSAGTELLPWYRLATLSDPHNVRNYMIGAWWLKSLNKPEQRREALDFLDEGIAANPDAYELYLMKGYVLREMNKPEKAVQNFENSADLALKQRPPGGPDSTPDWDITNDEQMTAAMTMHVMMTRDMKSTAAAIQVTRNYIERIPTEPSLKRILHSLGAEN